MHPFGWPSMCEVYPFTSRQVQDLENNNKNKEQCKKQTVSRTRMGVLITNRCLYLSSYIFSIYLMSRCAIWTFDWQGLKMHWPTNAQVNCNHKQNHDISPALRVHLEGQNTAHFPPLSPVFPTDTGGSGCNWLVHKHPGRTCVNQDTNITVWWLSAVHLVYSNDHLFHTKGIGEQGVFSGLSILGNTSLELTSTGSYDQHSTIGLGCSC